MSYKQQFAEMEKANKVQNLTPQFVKWEKKGQELIGEFRSAHPVASSMGEGTYTQYVFDTDEGLVKFSLGGAADKEFANVFRTGGLYKIIYDGQVKISGGRSVNQYRVFSAAAQDSLEVTDSDIPF